MRKSESGGLKGLELAESGLEKVKKKRKRKKMRELREYGGEMERQRALERAPTGYS